MKEEEYLKLVARYPSMAKFFHHVSGSSRQRGYYRRIPRTYKDKRARPASQLAVQLAFAESSHGAYGKKGFKDGLPIVAAINRENLRGKSFKKPPWQRLMDKLRESLREIAEVAKS